MNPLTREVLLTLVDEASDEQIISAIETPSTSVVVFRFLLKQYLIHLTSIPGTKLDHNATIFEWSQIFGYVQLEEQRKRATVSTQRSQPDPIASDTNDDDSDSSAAAQQTQRHAVKRLSIGMDELPLNTTTVSTADSLNIASPFGIPPRSTIRTSNANLDGAFNLFGCRQETIAEETEEDEFDEPTTNKYESIKQRPITPPMFALAQDPPSPSSSSSGTESHTPDFDKDMRESNSFRGDFTPREVSFRAFGHRNTIKSLMDHNGIDARLLALESKVSKTYDLSDDDEDEMMVEFDANLKLGHFRATLFMRLWLNITQYLDQNDKLMSLQLVSKKFRAIALAANHWSCVEIKLNQIQGQFRKLQRFLDTIQGHVERVTISDVSIHDAYDITAVLQCIPRHIKALVIESNHYRLPRFDLTQFNDHLEELKLCGLMDCNDSDLCNSIREMHQLRVLCFDLNSNDNVHKEKQTFIQTDQLEELWLPRGMNTNWFIQCVKEDKLSKLKVLRSFAPPCDEDKEQMMKHCFAYDILELIAQHCVNIECISIDCKLQKEFGETLAYLLDHCHHLQYVRFNLNIAYHVMDRNGERDQFFKQLAELKVKCLQILQQVSSSTNGKAMATSFQFYNTKHKRLQPYKEQSSDGEQYDLEFTLSER